MIFLNKKLLIAPQPPAFNVYNSVAQQVEQAKLKVQEQTPVVSVLQPVQVPVDDQTSGAMILVFSIFLTFFVGIAFVLVGYLIRSKKIN